MSIADSPTDLSNNDPYDLQLGDALLELQRRAYDLKHRHNQTWAQVATALEEPEGVVRRWAQAYIARTDAEAHSAQMSLFGETAS